MALINVDDNEYNFPDIKQGNTFKARTITFTDENGDPPSTSLSKIKMTFRKNSISGTIVKQIDETDGITIDDAVNWIVTITKFDVDSTIWDIAVFHYDCDTEDSSSEKETPLFGTMEVLKNL